MLQADPIILHSYNKCDLRFLAGDIQAYFDCIDGWAGKLRKFLECASDRRNCEILPCSNGQKCAPQIRPNKKVHKIIFWSDQASTKTEIGFCRLARNRFSQKRLQEKPLVYSTGLWKTKVFLFRALGKRKGRVIYGETAC